MKTTNPIRGKLKKDITNTIPIKLEDYLDDKCRKQIRDKLFWTLLFHLTRLTGNIEGTLKSEYSIYLNYYKIGRQINYAFK